MIYYLISDLKKIWINLELYFKSYEFSKFYEFFRIFLLFIYLFWIYLYFK